MSMLGTKQPTYSDGRTKQSFKDETDINQILKRAQKSGTISHLNKYEARYGDFSGFDFFEAQLKISQGAEMFAALPVELRREFNQSPAEFFDFVNDPSNKERLAKVLPALAEPGRQNLSASGVIPADALTAEEKAAAEQAALTAPSDTATPEKGSEEPTKADTATSDPGPGPSSPVT